MESQAGISWPSGCARTGDEAWFFCVFLHVGSCCHSPKDPLGTPLAEAPEGGEANRFQPCGQPRHLASGGANWSTSLIDAKCIRDQGEVLRAEGKAVIWH